MTDQQKRVPCQWYQSVTMVTASLKLHPPASRGEITATFRKNYCAILDGGEIYWECYLANPVVPSKCKLIVSKVRAEVKLLKEEALKWEEFEVEAPSEQSESDMESHDNKGDSPEPVVHADEINPLPPPPPQSTPLKSAPLSLEVQAPPTNHYVPEDVMFVKFLYHDFYDLGNRIKVKVQVEGISSSTCKVSFTDTTMEVKFQTSNERFLRSYEDCTPNTFFVWKIQLFGEIVVSESTFKVQPKSLEAYLKKTSTVRWKLLSPSAHDNMKGITQKFDKNSELNEQSPDNAVGSILNDLNVNPILTTNILNKSSTLSNNSLMDTLTSGNVVVTPTPETTPTNHVNSSLNQSSSSGYSSNSDCSESEKKSNVAANDPPPTMKIDGSSNRQNLALQPSKTGLMNVGNSCFMNSIVQCLSNTEPLRDYFVGGHYLADINRENPLGFKGELAKCFSTIINKLWSGDYQYFSPKSLKMVIASRSKHFGGYQQQDSHEFMSYLLDGLHEDLNRVQKKPLTPLIETDGITDSAAADKAWETYRQRNDSYFVDNFQGQFKSTLVCPECNNVSMTFDPFMSLSVPLPLNLRQLPIFFVPQDPSKIPLKFILKLPPEANLELLKASVARKTGISMTQLRVFEAYGGKFQSLLSSNQKPIKSIGENDVIMVSEVLPKRSDVVEINIIQRVKIPPFPTKCAACLRQKSANKKLFRCGKCRAVGYCDEECQRKDWSSHTRKCGQPTPIGFPFVVSFPASQFTYSHLATVAEQFARRSVDVVLPSSTSILRENTDSGQENTESEQENTDSGQENTDSGHENTDSEQENTERLPPKKKPKYQFVPVDRYGDKKEGTTPLRDLGEEHLAFDGDFLVMDWNNDSREKESVQVTPKEILEHKVDPVAPSPPPSARTSSSKVVTLDQCIELFTQPELLSKEEAWYCSKCKDHREATKQISLWRLPRFLIIHLKRFSYFRDKITFKVDFPLKGLNMAPFMLGEAASHFPQDTPPIYDLYATVNHYGAVHMGHYYAQVCPSSREGLKKDEWLLYDDECVNKLPQKDVIDNNAYILFYRHRPKQ